jgi:Sigma-70 factor, region 1.1
MAGWNPIATAPREVGRPLLLYPRPRPVYEQQSEGPMLDLIDPAVKRMIRLAKTRGYVTYDELNAILPPEEFTREQIEGVLGQLDEMGITVVEAEEDEESPPATAAEGQEKRVENSPLAALAIYISVFEGCWDGSAWRTSIGRPCEPTHWMAMPSPPLTLVRR